MKKCILISGATGYLGSQLLKKWIFIGHTVIVLKRTQSSIHRIKPYEKKCIFFDIDKPDWEKVFTDHKIDIVVHTATCYGRKGESLLDVIEANYLFPVKLLDEAIKNNVKSFINTASSLPKNINNYSISKSHFRDWLFFKKQRIKAINLTLEYFYGPNDDDWKFINMVLKKFMSNVSHIDFTDGNQKRDFIYIDDLVSAYDCILNNLTKISSGINIPIGFGKSYKIRDVVKTIKKLTNNNKTELRFGAIENRSGEVLDQFADIKFIKSLGFKPKFSLPIGLKELLNKQYV